MGPARLGWRDIPLAGPPTRCAWTWRRRLVADPAAVSMGNPHAVFFVADVDAVRRCEPVGPVLEHHPLFPQRANIGFAQVLARDRNPPARLGARRRPDAGLRLRRLRRAWSTAVRRGLTGRAGDSRRWTAASWRSNGARTATC